MSFKKMSLNRQIGDNIQRQRDNRQYISSRHGQKAGEKSDTADRVDRQKERKKERKKGVLGTKKEECWKHENKYKIK